VQSPAQSPAIRDRATQQCPRAHVNHLPDGPEQEARDRSLAAADPLAASAWIYAYDAETAAAEAGSGGVAFPCSL
jgi:hypothetical protein